MAVEFRLSRPSGEVPAVQIESTLGASRGRLIRQFYIATEILKPGAMIPFNKHDNAEQVLIPTGTAGDTPGRH